MPGPVPWPRAGRPPRSRLRVRADHHLPALGRDHRREARDHRVPGRGPRRGAHRLPVRREVRLRAVPGQGGGGQPHLPDDLGGGGPHGQRVLHHEAAPVLPAPGVRGRDDRGRRARDAREAQVPLHPPRADAEAGADGARGRRGQRDWPAAPGPTTQRAGISRSIRSIARASPMSSCTSRCAAVSSCSPKWIVPCTGPQDASAPWSRCRSR